MPVVPTTSQRLDPYKNFKFRIRWDGRDVAGVSKVSARSGPPRWCRFARAATRAPCASRPGRRSMTRSRWRRA